MQFMNFLYENRLSESPQNSLRRRYFGWVIIGQIFLSIFSTGDASASLKRMIVWKRNTVVDDSVMQICRIDGSVLRIIQIKTGEPGKVIWERKLSREVLLAIKRSSRFLRKEVYTTPLITELSPRFGRVQAYDYQLTDGQSSNLQGQILEAWQKGGSHKINRSSGAAGLRAVLDLECGIPIIQLQ